MLRASSTRRREAHAMLYVGLDLSRMRLDFDARLAGWEVRIADALKAKGLAPLACKTDKIDAWVLAEPGRRDLVPRDLAARPGGQGRARARPLPPAPGQAQDRAQEPRPRDPDRPRHPHPEQRPVWRRRPAAARAPRPARALALDDGGQPRPDRHARRADRRLPARRAPPRRRPPVRATANHLPRRRL